jgi:hypothetical protein
MVYAASMVTIKNFEKALERKLFWQHALREGMAHMKILFPGFACIPTLFAMQILAKALSKKPTCSAISPHRQAKFQCKCPVH